MYKNINYNKDSLIKYIKGNDIKYEDEVLAYTIFYKYTSLRMLGAEYSEMDIKKYLNVLKKPGGFSLKKDDYFQDIRSTYIIIELISNIKKRGIFDDEKR